MTSLPPFPTPPAGAPPPPPPASQYPGPPYAPPGYGFAPPRPLSPGGQPLAEFGDRLVAYLIDSAILFAVSLVVTVPVIIAQFSIMIGVLDDLQRRALEGPPGPDFFEVFGAMIGPLVGLYAVMLVLMLLIYYVYRVELMFRTGQTVGKRAMKLRVVPLDPTGQLTRGMATRRWLIDSVAATFVPFLVYLDGLWQLWDKPLQQCLHDRFAQTVVVKVDR